MEPPQQKGGIEMAAGFEAVKVSDHVHWVGAIDWGIRDFHGYQTRRGSTYNAYLIMGDDPILIDTVKAPFKDELLARVASVVDPKSIRYLVSNHAEMDHSGSLPAVVEEVQPEKVFASPLGVKALSDHFHMDREIITVKDGDSMELAGVKLAFWETRMLHWPDSMMTYLADDRLLFSQDGFGMHLATAKRFADELPRCVMDEENAKYYANILLPYSAMILRLLDRVAASGLEIETVCPDHGPMYRTPEDIGRAMSVYSTWAKQQPTMKAVIVFDTMWGSTQKMARALSEGLAAGGAEVVVHQLRASHRTDVVTDLLDAGALAVGTPTLNNLMFPTVADVLTYMRGLKPKNLIGAIFGSYGWSGEGVKYVAEQLEQMKVELVGEPLNIKYVPAAEALETARALGTAVAERLKEVVGSGS
jgi:flavorubredoxin